MLNDINIKKSRGTLRCIYRLKRITTINENEKKKKENVAANENCILRKMDLKTQNPCFNRVCLHSPSPASLVHMLVHFNKMPTPFFFIWCVPLHAHTRAHVPLVWCVWKTAYGTSICNTVSVSYFKTSNRHS